MNIVIVGYRCTGKSTVGKSLADELGWDFVDTDHLITLREGSDIDEIVSAKGWEYFRYLEKMVIYELSERNNTVIATGGGVVMDNENIDNLKKNGFVIWLRVDADIIRSRMENDRRTSSTRPSLTGKDPLDEIKEVLEIRNPFYRKARDIEVDTGFMTAGEVTDYIKGEYLARLSGKI